MKMKKLIVAISILLGCTAAYAINRTQISDMMSNISQSREFANTLQKFMSVAWEDFTYRSCEPSTLEASCTTLTMTATQKQTMLARAKAIDSQLYQLETERHKWIQSQ